MAEIKGTNVVAPVVPLDTADVHPTHAAAYGLGGYRTVASDADRDAIPAPRREQGMLVFVTGTGQTWRLGADLTTWTEGGGGGGATGPTGPASTVTGPTGPQGPAGTTSWAGITDKPSTFAPSDHAHGSITSDGLIAGNTVSGYFVTTSDGGELVLSGASTGRTLLGLGGAAVLNVGTAAGTVAAGNDARLSDARTPTGAAGGDLTGNYPNPTIAPGAVVTADISNSAVTYAKIQNVSATDRLLGRSTAGAGVVEEITCSAFGRSLIDDADAAAARTTLGLAAVATSGSASDLSAGTLPSARFPSQITPSGTFEVRAANTSGTRGAIRASNSSSTSGSYIDIGIGTPGYFNDEALFGFNGTVAFRIIGNPAGQVAFNQGFRMPNNAQIIGDANSNAYINMNNGAGTLQISSVTAMEFQKSYVAIGRWDTHGAFHVGANNTVAGATTNGGVIVAGAHARSRLHGQMVTSGGRFANTGDAQASTYHLRASTTDATATTLFLDGSAARLTIPAQSCWSWVVRVAAYNSTDNTAAAWTITGGIRRDNAGNTALLGTAVSNSFADSGMASAAVAVTADDTNEALQIAVTGLASKTIRWHATVMASEVSAGAAT